MWQRLSVAKGCHSSTPPLPRKCILRGLWKPVAPRLVAILQMTLSPIMSSVVVVVVLLAAAYVREVDSRTCTQKELGVFNDVSPQVQQCAQTSGLGFQMPPSGTLPPIAKTKLCKSPSCKKMLGAVDDLNLPRCEVFFDGKNATLQTGINIFASICDFASPAPSPMKKKSSSSSSSSSSSGYGRKRTPEKESSAVHVRGGNVLHTLVVVLVAALVGAMLLR